MLSTIYKHSNHKMIILLSYSFGICDSHLKYAVGKFQAVSLEATTVIALVMVNDFILGPTKQWKIMMENDMGYTRIEKPTLKVIGDSIVGAFPRNK